jgi:hypothetical protein
MLQLTTAPFVKPKNAGSIQLQAAMPPLYANDADPDDLVTPLQVTEVNQPLPGLDEKPDTLKNAAPGQPIL